MTQTGADPEIFIVSERKLDCEEDSSVEEPPENSGTNRTVKKPGLFDAPQTFKLSHRSTKVYNIV